jgi:hypothetical protein
MSRERKIGTELDQNVLSAYTNTFISRRDLYPIQLPNGTYISVHKELTGSMVAAHIKGHITIGAYALDRAGWAKWICFDADEEEYWRGLKSLANDLMDTSLVPYLEPSRRGGHLWLFTPTIPGFQVRRFGKQLLSGQGLAERKGRLPGIEIYPKQDRPITGPGSCVRLPLGIHKLSGKRYHFVTLDGAPLAPTIREQIAILGNPERVSQAFIDQILGRAPQPKVVSPTPHFKPSPEALQRGGC